MELLIRSGPKGVLQALQGDREAAGIPSTFQKAAVYAEKCSTHPVVGALHNRDGSWPMRDAHALAPLQALPSHLALTWAEACGRCLNQNTKSRDVVLAHTSCFCTKEEGITPKVQQSSPG